MLQTKSSRCVPLSKEQTVDWPDDGKASVIRFAFKVSERTSRGQQVMRSSRIIMTAT